MNRQPALRGGPSNTLRSPTSVSGVRVGSGPSVLSVIDPPTSASRQPPALRISLLGSSCQCARPAQDAGASDRVSAGTVLALLEHGNALNQVAARKASPLLSLPVVGMGLRDARFRSGLVTSGLAALGAISLGEACGGAAPPRRKPANRFTALSRAQSWHGLSRVSPPLAAPEWKARSWRPTPSISIGSAFTG
jgi:hypothetical protein